MVTFKINFDDGSYFLFSGPENAYNCGSIFHILMQFYSAMSLSSMIYHDGKSINKHKYLLTYLIIYSTAKCY